MYHRRGLFSCWDQGDRTEVFESLLHDGVEERNVLIDERGGDDRGEYLRPAIRGVPGLIWQFGGFELRQEPGKFVLRSVRKIDGALQSHCLDRHAREWDLTEKLNKGELNKAQSAAVLLPYIV